jgi:uncharacterized DUF497 family protein
MAIKFEWDETKRLKNIEKHGIDFVRADLIFDGLHVLKLAKTVQREVRWTAIGMIDDVHVTAIFTKRGGVIRLISMRRSRNEERREYQKLLGR